MKHKHKKTRKEKIIADYRHQVYIFKNKNTPPNNSPLAISINENSYFNTHVLKDVSKTGILTCSIIAAQIILFFLLKRHILSIPNLNY
ncbi:MAG: hypothetical protein A3B47_01340 [Candidatus Levybacteria bacterium RIFCSPLOWO2_01_FULL_39_24]|nr:MAG: hypothetical protein A2800_03375 [Candidatus Levybacteria bacterium RIFCSPHIGHO2_01_FULL_40_16]OGH28631.1 MAG: hypothetical protein A3E12_03275 [Candidatus Levybacteria bacterium RIFCSPHIGHO2_12_FULL_39_9]OGH46020.1 MAG: hypothetical protein A3B47_01340 [Candidatus Levybacteria bacterium RIFCSPLOWO2_01_FULL_39_24]